MSFRVPLSAQEPSASLFSFAFTTLDFPDATSTIANAINDLGDIVGQYNDSAGVTHAFLMRQGKFASLDFPGATATLAFGINNLGETVDFTRITVAMGTAFCYSAAGSPQLISQTLRLIKRMESTSWGRSWEPMRVMIS